MESKPSLWDSSSNKEKVHREVGPDEMSHELFSQYSGGRIELQDKTSGEVTKITTDANSATIYFQKEGMAVEEIRIAYNDNLKGSLFGDELTIVSEDDDTAFTLMKK